MATEKAADQSGGEQTDELQINRMVGLTSVCHTYSREKELDKDQVDKLRRYEKIRCLGRRRFIWSHGIVRFGVPLAIVLAVSNFAEHHGGVAVLLVIVSAIGLLGGYIFGDALWEVAELQYRRAKAEGTLYDDKDMILVMLSKLKWFLILAAAFFAVALVVRSEHPL